MLFFLWFIVEVPTLNSLRRSRVSNSDDSMAKPAYFQAIRHQWDIFRISSSPEYTSSSKHLTHCSHIKFIQLATTQSVHIPHKSLNLKLFVFYFWKKGKVKRSMFKQGEAQSPLSSFVSTVRAVSIVFLWFSLFFGPNRSKWISRNDKWHVRGKKKEKTRQHKQHDIEAFSSVPAADASALTAAVSCFAVCGC